MMHHANFIPRGRRERRRTNRTLRRWGIGLGVQTLVMCVVLPGGRLALTHASGVSTPEGVRAKMRLEAAEAERKSVRENVERVKREIDAARTAGSHPDWSLLLAALVRSRGEDAMLESIKVLVKPMAAAKPKDSKDAKSAGGNAGAAARVNQQAMVEIAGIAASPGKVFEFAQRLELLGVFDRVRIKDTHAHSGGKDSPGESIWFAMEAVTSDVEEEKSK